jgi:hypothetical protein
LPASGNVDPKIQKLEMVIKKGDMIIGMLDKKGLVTDPYKKKFLKARNNLEEGRIEEAYILATECIKELKGLREKSSSAPSKKGDDVKQRRGKGVFALIRDNTAEVEKKIEEWKVIIGGWRKKGYLFETDDSLFSRSFDQIEKRFISIGEQIEKAERIRGQISRLRDEFSHVGNSHFKKLDDIERAVFRLDRLDDIERRLKSVISVIKSVEGRYKVLRNRINRFNRKGLNISSLEEMIDNDEDLDYLDKQFNIYESNIDFLLKEKNKLITLKESRVIDRFKDQVNSLEKMIDDPWMLDHVVERMLEIEKAIKKAKEQDKLLEEESKRRSEIRKSIDKYRTEGFKVEMVEQLLDDDMNLLEEEYDIFIRQTARLRGLKEKLFKLDATGFEEDVSGISQRLFDPAGIDEIEKELNELKDRILNHRMRSQKIENAIKEWSGMGFKISRLENALRNNIDEAEKIYEDYSQRIKELMEYEARLKEMNPRDIQNQTHRINLKIKNPELIESIRKEMSQLQKEVTGIESIRQKRMELNNLLKTWKSQGYKIDSILISTGKEKTMEGLEKVILQFTRAIASLESFKNEFPNFERGWFPDLEKEIKEKMDDPEEAGDTLKKFTELKNQVKKEEKRRGEISRKLTELSNRGIDISRIHPLLTGESEALTAEYESFKNKIKRLLKLKATLLKEAHKNGDQELEMFAKGMTDPYQIEGYENQTSNRDSQGKQESGNSDPEVPDIEEMLTNAKELLKNEKLEESLSIFERILTIDPDNKQGNFFKKKALLKLKNRPQEEKTSPPISSDAKISQQIGDSGQGGDPNCLSCKGTGKCVWCDGTGNCSTCNGSGKTFGEDCPTCKGSGKCTVCKGHGNCTWCNS